jgi:hypothetical protein
MHKTFALILIFVGAGALCCSSVPSSTTAKLVQSPSVNEPRPVAPASCPVTAAPMTPFTPPGEHEMGANDNDFWLGTEKLWIALPKSGEVWGWAPHAPGHEHDLTAKIFWGSVDFDYNRKEDYDLKVTGRRLDGDAPPLIVEKLTNALFIPHAAMLTGVYVPTPGCWEITGDRRGQKLSFVAWIYPVNQGDQ